jgi:O-antigen/teichoic acid export membrane protein
MGIVSKQATINSILYYIGVFLGYVNVIILFPAYFSSEQFGLVQLLVGISFIYSQFSSVGLIYGINRYFPFFKSEDKKHKGLLTYVTVISSGGFIILTVLYIVFKPLIINLYIEKSRLFTDYYLLIIPLSFFTLAFNILEALARVILKTGFSNFLREVLLRLLITAGIFLFVFKVFNIDTFIYYYVLTYGIVAVLLLFQIIISKEFKMVLSVKHLEKFKFFDFLRFNLYNLFSGAAMFVGQKVDVLIIGAMLGLAQLGAYSLYFYIASVIYIPMKSLSRISFPIIANHWKTNDTMSINEIYKKTSVIQLIFGLIIFIGVIINRHNLFALLKKQDYIDNFLIFPFIGLAILFDVTAGLNSDIISNSPKFRYNALFNVVFLISALAGNLILIPYLGIMGAAIAIAIAFFIFNFIKWLFLNLNYDMQPLSYRQIILLLISVAVFLLGEVLPVINMVYLDILYRSTIITVIFFTAVYIFRLSEDLNDKFRILLKKYLTF